MLCLRNIPSYFTYWIVMKHLLFSVLLVFVTTILWSKAETDGLELHRGPADKGESLILPNYEIRTLIPNKPETIKYHLHGSIDSISSGGFKPFHDTPSFVNFSSVATGTPYGHIYHSGTCYGITYMTSLWYSGIVKDLQEIYSQDEMSEIQSIGTRHLNFGMGRNEDNQQCKDEHDQIVECPTGSSEGVGTTEKMDGLTYLASWAKLSNTRFFNRCGVELANCRLYKISESQKLKTFVRQTMIHHHFHQFMADRVDLNVRKPIQLDEQIDELKDRIATHGSVLFYWIVYSSSDQWSLNSYKYPDDITWDKFEAAHAMLLYEISEVDVKVSNESRKAIKLHLYDPNKTYRDHTKLKTAEGAGTYLLYFPDSKTMSFSNAMQKFYSLKNKNHSGDSSRISKNLQGGFLTIDGKQTVIGYIDFYEGHSKQFDDAVDFDAFYTGAVMTPLDIKLFNLFAKSKSCDNIKAEIKNLRKNPANDNYLFIKTWFYDNRKALQNHLRIEKVIEPRGYCDPFE